MGIHLDGNVLGGELGELFSVDITGAACRCASCGVTGTIAQSEVYADAPGLVARCAHCGEVILRLVRGPGRAWLDLHGISSLEIVMPPGP
jgi:hypothetical protein